MEKVVEDWRSREGAGLIAGLVIGALCQGIVARFISRRGRGGNRISESDLSSDEDNSGGSAAGEHHKLVLCVRTDLKMQKGKIAAQASHATLGAYKKARSRDITAVRHWEHHAQPKIALQIASHAEAKQLDANARRQGLVTYMVYDAGRTQIAAGSMTVLAIGPGPDDVVNRVTGHLKLL